MLVCLQRPSAVPAADSSLGTLPSACNLLSTSSAAEQQQANCNSDSDKYATGGAQAHAPAEQGWSRIARTCRTHAAATTASLAAGGW